MTSRPFQVLFTSLAFVVALMSVKAADAAEYTVKMHVNQPATQNSYHYIYATQFAERMRRYTNGEFVVKIFPGAQLGKDPAVFEQMQLGAIETAVLAFPNLVQHYKPFNVFTLPFLFEDFKSAAFAFEGPTAQELYKGFEQKTGVKTLGVFNGGFRGITNNIRAINKVGDFKGLKVRVPGSPILISTLESLGMKPVSLSGGEIFAALQLGTVDGQESTVSWAYGQGFAEVQKFLTVTNHAVTGTGLYINSKYYNALPKEMQKKVNRAAKESLNHVNGFNQMYDRTILEKYKAAGLKITQIKAEDVRPLVKPIWERYASSVGGMNVIESLITDSKTNY